MAYLRQDPEPEPEPLARTEQPTNCPNLRILADGKILLNLNDGKLIQTYDPLEATLRLANERCGEWTGTLLNTSVMPRE